MNRPAPVEVTYKNMRYLITHHSTNATLKKFTEKLKKYGVTAIVRVLQFPRQKWRGTFNSKPFFFLLYKLCFKYSNGQRNNCCIQ
uniref:Uncharacterized protein n=1 Tax=Sus scrofa TaxID=9823 RepID=A0A8D2C718_PIG